MSNEYEMKMIEKVDSFNLKMLKRKQALLVNEREIKMNANFTPVNKNFKFEGSKEWQEYLRDFTLIELDEKIFDMQIKIENAEHKKVEAMNNE